MGVHSPKVCPVTGAGGVRSYNTLFSLDIPHNNLPHTTPQNPPRVSEIPQFLIAR